MIAWSVVCPALKEVFSLIALDQPVNPTFLARWAGEPTEAMHGEVLASVHMDVKRTMNGGHDEHRDEWNTETGSQTERIVGLRTLYVELRVEALEELPDQAQFAWTIIERMRTRILRRKAQELLASANMALITVGPAMPVKAKFNKVKFSCVACEVSFSVGYCDSEVDESFDWFEHVLLTTQFTNPAGVLLPAPLNVTDLAIPPLS